MLLIDGVKYEKWIPPNEDALEQIVNEHSEEIFGKNSVYFYKKQKLNTLSGVGTIPDGLAIVLGDLPQWHIVEVELSSHDPYQHVVPQVDKFINAVDNPNTRNKIIEILYRITRDDLALTYKIQQELRLDKDIHKFLSDLIIQPPTITIIVENNTEQLKEALRKYPKKRVIEFQTFIREGVGLPVHAHLFEPLTTTIPTRTPILIRDKPRKPKPKDSELTKAKKVTFEELINAGLLHDNQVLIFSHTRPFNNEQAKVISSSNELMYLKDGQQYSKSELARQLLIKHGFKHDEHGVAGPRYWITEDGKSLKDLEEQIRIKRGDRKSGSDREGR